MQSPDFANPLEGVKRAAVSSVNGYVGTGLGDPRTGDSCDPSGYYVATAVGTLGTLGQNTKGSARALCPVSIVCHLAF